MNFSDLIRKLVTKQVLLDLNIPDHLTLVKKIYGTYYAYKHIYNKMYSYYKGDTDAMKKYKFVTERSNLKINTNYIKKFIKEEVSYTVGNSITYESRNDDANIINDIEYYTAHWDELHDTDLMKYLLIFTKVYEIYYLDSNADFCSKIIKPTEGYAYVDNASGKVLFFIHAFKNDFDTINTYVDIYTDEFIYHYDGHFKEIANPTENIFGEVPISVGKLTLEEYHDSLYKDIKGLQDAFETNLSDIGNEISDFRNAYLVFMGCQVDEEKIPDMKRLGILNADGEKSKIEWLIKNINDTFIQNTLDRYVDTMYQISCHINHNEGMVSNLSGIALRSRLIALENKCELEEKAHKNIIKNRMKFLCKYLDLKKNKNYDYKDIKALYTPNIPIDDLSTAQMLAQIPEGVISKDTARGLFSFINNKVTEAEKVKKEQQEELPETNLDKVAD
ncbi:phage portal protein [Clostridium saccharobutylicum]|uniref:SPP1 family phage portal protein n=1 Tax=Clostridium saccharobutylicum DSM 13864 TaxID=1345695 RepID=U5MT80_CLOSA|nr:phage portal protein [Clostridium saccharobutylicum]AGX43964.1 SPP1 family phage portal protein [Clostridium saccharobutylicum DSM 13864]AQR91261.1 phage portal protein, SPP1 Gp6-like [Clostridium saccharobutylicum]AQS01165.1 phage portal protein, SPP1 Gp6-like [Clostridium saccharobutylicum]AQS10578.1 phage portal protein, SPP1 Gp6-like [Clostridium saccharobutylicum]AQS15148.1 phage portal protein, SPP1 Gp6-like [Clostridium saccharobutylicum]